MNGCGVGLKSTLTAWVMGQAVNDVLKRATVTDASKRQRVVKAVQRMIKKPKDEPVAYGGIIGVAVALGAAFGLDLTAEQLAVTVSTVIAIVSFLQRACVTPVKGE